MRILHLVHQYSPEYVGGTELYTKSLAENQAANGLTPAIFVPASRSKKLPAESVENGVRVYRFPVAERNANTVFLSNFYQPEIETAVNEIINREKPDLVHIQHLKGLPVALIDHLERQDVPFVITLHDYWYLCANAQLLTNYDNTICSGPKWGLNCGRCALTRAGWTKAQALSPLVAPVMTFRNRKLANVLSRARKVIAPTHFIRNIYISFGVPESLITVIPHGIDVPEGISLDSRRSDSKLVISFVGGLSWQKGVHVLIEAVNQLPADHFSLTIYGDKESFPDYTSDLTAQIRHPGIELAGRLPHNELWMTLAQSDVIVVPSLWYENSPLVVQEAFAVGVPVIASDIGALQERVIDGEDGLLFPAGDAPALRDILVKLQQEPQILEKLRLGIKPVQTIEDHTDEIIDLYRTVTNQ